MIEIFWGCLIGGILFAILSLILGDLFDHGLDSIGHALPVDHLDFLHPTTIVGGITAFGGAGVILSRYTSLDPVIVVALAVGIATLLSVIVHFVYVKPMRRSENSIGFSMTEYSGRIGQVTIPIPERGYGEVMVSMGGANTCQIAASFDGETIPTGTPVVVVEIKDGTLYVSPFNHTLTQLEEQNHG